MLVHYRKIKISFKMKTNIRQNFFSPWKVQFFNACKQNKGKGAKLKNKGDFGIPSTLWRVFQCV